MMIFFIWEIESWTASHYLGVFVFFLNRNRFDVIAKKRLWKQCKSNSLTLLLMQNNASADLGSSADPGPAGRCSATCSYFAVCWFDLFRCSRQRTAACKKLQHCNTARVSGCAVVCRLWAVGEGKVAQHELTRILEVGRNILARVKKTIKNSKYCSI